MRSKIKSKRLATLVIIFIFAFTSLISLISFAPATTKASGAAEYTSSLRFRQVEAGEDFAIALTYNNELYGWSLTKVPADDDYRLFGDATGNNITLGEYYPGVPTKITPTFYKDNATGTIAAYERFTNNPAVTPDDSIRKIAVTRTAAAFITGAGYVYTWGYDNPADEFKQGTLTSDGVNAYSDGIMVKNQILFRNEEDNYSAVYGGANGVTSINYYIPQPVMSKRLKVLNDHIWQFPAGMGIGANNISGSENNFVITTSLNYISWGRSLYSLNKNSVGFSVVKSPIEPYTNTGAEIIGGSDYYITIDNSSTVNFKGKNFYLKKDAPFLNPIFALTGNNAAATNKAYIHTGAAELINMEQAGANEFENVTSSMALRTAADNLLRRTVFLNNSGSNITIDSYSDNIGAGNGFIYFIDEDGHIARVGNDVWDDQFDYLSTTPLLQVVAGKIPSASTGISNTDGTYSAAVFRPNTSVDLVSVPNTGFRLGGFSSGRPTPIAATNRILDAYVDVKGTETFISAALGTNNNVYAWSRTTAVAAVPVPVIFYHDAAGSRPIVFDANTKIVKLSAGYGNNLFALDNVGKIYRITETAGVFSGKLIDSFYSPNAAIPVANTGTTRIDNWTTNATGKSVTLTGAYNPVGARTGGFGSSFNNAFKVSTGYFYGAAVAADDVSESSDLTDAMLALGNSNLKNFIKSSNSGDLYRILLKNSVPIIDSAGTNIGSAANGGNASSPFNDGTGTISDLKAPDGVTGIANADLGTVKFYYDTSNDEIPAAALSKYLMYRAVYDSATNDLHFEIKPLRSTMGKQIVMKFYIGRFDNISRFSSTSATFYDAQLVELAMKFENTTASTTPLLNSNSTISGGTNTAIPLLDPNNPDNKSYSIAVTDVSSGFAAIGALTNNAAAFNTLVLNEIASKDSGAPLSRKVSSGNLTHTLGTAAGISNNNATYYNDKYLYLLEKDVDGNKYVKGIDNQPSKNGVEYVPVNLELSLAGIVTDTAAFANIIKTDANIKDKFLQSFNNIYGFYDLRYDAATNRLFLKYDVARVNASVSTGSIGYETSGQDADINRPIFTPGAENAVKFSVEFTEQTETGEDPNTAAKPAVHNVPFHVQASLRFKDNIVSGPVNEPNDNTGIKTVVYAPGGVNKISMNLGEARPMTVQLSSLFTDTSRIGFAYNGEMNDAAYAAFKSRIDSKLIDVTLESDKVTFQPRDTATNGLDISFVVEVRRFANSGNTIKFVNGAAEQEVVKLEFRILSIPTSFFVNTSAAGSYPVKIDGLTVNVKDRIISSSWDYIEIAKVLISDNNLTSSSVSDRVVDYHIDGHTIKFTALKSGEVTVWYFLKRFNETIADSFKLTVESVSLLPYKLSIANSENIYLDTVKSSLRAMNSSSTFQAFDTLLLDDVSYDEQMPKGTYYQVYREDEGAWETVKQSEISFIDSTVLSTSKDSIKLTLGNVSSADSQLRSRIVLKFISPDGEHTFEAAIEISPANKLLMNVADDGVTYHALNINIAYGEDFADQEANAAFSPFRNQNNSVTIPLTYFVNFLPQGQRAEFSGAKIGYVRPAEGYETYFSYEKAPGNSGVDILIITPTYPTKLLENDRIMVSMSVNTVASGGAQSANYIFSFYISISGLTIDLDKEQYGQIFLITMLSVFALLLIVFFIRMTVFWRRKAQQKRIIRKNQMLIKMRDKMHNKTAAVSKEQLVRTKMKMEDPKYAKMFTTMRTDKEVETGISLDNSAIAQKAENKTKAAGKTKKKGKTSNIDQLKAELEAKKMAFAQMQGGVPPAMAMDSTMGGIEMDQSIIDSGPVFDNYQGGLSREDVESQIKAKLAEDSFLEFETIEPEENNIV